MDGIFYPVVQDANTGQQLVMEHVSVQCHAATIVNVINVVSCCLAVMVVNVNNYWGAFHVVMMLFVTVVNV